MEQESFARFPGGTPGIELDGGVGVGRVTKPGLPVEVGQAAINPVPRKMIREAVEAVLNRYELNRGVRVVVSVPDGEEIAKKTLNARLGIVGGISILGTRGIVVPFSTAAYKASVAQAIRVAVKGAAAMLFFLPEDGPKSSGWRCIRSCRRKRSSKWGILSGSRFNNVRDKAFAR